MCSMEEGGFCFRLGVVSKQIRGQSCLLLSDEELNFRSELGPLTSLLPRPMLTVLG